MGVCILELGHRAHTETGGTVSIGVHGGDAGQPARAPAMSGRPPGVASDTR